MVRWKKKVIQGLVGQDWQFLESAAVALFGAYHHRAIIIIIEIIVIMIIIMIRIINFLV